LRCFPPSLKELKEKLATLDRQNILRPTEGPSADSDHEWTRIGDEVLQKGNEHWENLINGRKMIGKKMEKKRPSLSLFCLLC
jgi:hypothetical protein